MLPSGNRKIEHNFRMRPSSPKKKSGRLPGDATTPAPRPRPKPKSKPKPKPKKKDE